jgi:hypothetical protein
MRLRTEALTTARDYRILSACARITARRRPCSSRGNHHRQPRMHDLSNLAAMRGGQRVRGGCGFAAEFGSTNLPGGGLVCGRPAAPAVARKTTCELGFSRCRSDSSLRSTLMVSGQARSVAPASGRGKSSPPALAPRCALAWGIPRDSQQSVGLRANPGVSGETAARAIGTLPDSI